MIDVHKLAGQLGVSAEVILRAAAELGGVVGSGSQLSEELADQIRAQLRTAQRGFGGSPMFSGGGAGAQAGPPRNPAARPATFASAQPENRSAGRADLRTVAPAFASRPGEARAPQRGADTASGGGLPQPGPEVAAQAASLSSQLAAQSAASGVAAEWLAAGLGSHDRHIIEFCERNGLTPQDVRRRVDGQTVASRLKNGESLSSIRSRMPESS